MTQLRIPAVYMRGGTSKGVFFLAPDLPEDPVERDRVLLRVIGSPDRYGQHIDGMGGATSSTSKVVIIAQSARPGFDVDYLFAAVAVTAPVIDWSGNCGNLSAAVGPFAISSGLVRAPRNGMATVRIWQANIRKTIVAHVPMRDGEVQEEGDFELDGGRSDGTGRHGRAGHRDATAHAQAGVRRRTAGLRRLGWQADRGKLDRSHGAHLLDGQPPPRDDRNGCRRDCGGSCNPRHARASHRARTQRWPRAVRPCLRHVQVGAEVRQEAGQWTVERVLMSRSARRLMEGWVRVPAV